MLYGITQVAELLFQLKKCIRMHTRNTFGDEAFYREQWFAIQLRSLEHAVTTIFDSHQTLMRRIHNFFQKRTLWQTARVASQHMIITTFFLKNPNKKILTLTECHLFFRKFYLRRIGKLMEQTRIRTTTFKFHFRKRHITVLCLLLKSIKKI